MNRPGPGPQPLRGMSGFPAPQQAQARNATLATARLPNGKIGGAANWNFNLPGASTLQSNQQRTMGTMGSFAQSLGGSQPTTALDLSLSSEFPSLSGASQQSQSQNPVWANASQRAAQHTPVQRQQHPPTSQPPSRASQTQQLPVQQPSQPPHDDMFPSGAQFANRLDDFRNGGQGISSQIGAGSQPQTGNIDEFPPLGRNVGNVGNVAAELAQERRTSLMQGAGFGTYNSGIGTSRSPVNQGPNGALGQEKEDLNNTLMSGQRNFSDPQQQLQQRQQQANEGQEASAAAQSAEQPPLAQMSELDRFGLSGLLRMIHSESPDVASLAVGQDLMTLGLDLNQPEPLHTSFASPFVSSMSAVPLEQDFSLPSCYNVANIQPLSSRIPGFSDETLFYIFYSMPRDIMQELVAEELMGRKWRYHKLERCWLTRDETYPGPVDVERGVSERGVYLLWDHASWKKIRREFILRYEDLDNRLDANRTMSRAAVGQTHAS
ncbi:Putative NOT2 family protein [Penicillium brasilianum]|uniref:Putative NOT2 family protein n=1 Tax=Penicillium brasilianum TaxID=104259 RepID=A0A0F7TDP1_PENBI|nr:Putative NOT2 family protein [Penicillium brasilianum]